MNSFIGISKSQTTNLAVVAPGIAEALLATALGLVAAIPAVIIYNHFARVDQRLHGLVNRARAPRPAAVARSRPPRQGAAHRAPRRSNRMGASIAVNDVDDDSDLRRRTRSTSRRSSTSSSCC